MDNHRRMAERDPEYRKRCRQSERGIREWVKLYGEEGVRTGVVRIPLIVHIVLNPDVEGQEYEKTQKGKEDFEAELKKQIAFLSKDFRRENDSAKETPKEFLPFAADARIEFALATRDPECKATSGINWVPTKVAGWTKYEQGMKEKDKGGVEPWDVTKYLNLWIVHYTDNGGGFGTPPGVEAKLQGITCTHSQIVNPFNRILTHEAGHWLNLLHVWGDDEFEADRCQKDDQVADTPLQEWFSPYVLPCRTHPAVSCDPSTSDMFMNFMDLSPLVCMNLFTMGQVARMDAALTLQRPGIIASDGLSPPAATPGPDLWMQDTPGDVGAEPDASGEPMYVSNDIWVRTIDDGDKNQSHQNPEFKAGGDPNHVYVRVRNRGCKGTGTGTLRVYWAKASSGLSWPSPWNGSFTMPALMGKEIGSVPVSVDAGEYEVYSFPWQPPNPDDYASFGGDKAHFCLLARIETQATAPFGMNVPETLNLYENVRSNNKIVWKNITVVGSTDDGDDKPKMIVANFGEDEREERLRFDAVEVGGISVFDWGRVVVTLPPSLAEHVDGAATKGVKPLGGGRFELLASGAAIGNFKTAPGNLHAIEAAFEPRDKFESLGARVFELDAMQFVGAEQIGGVRFALKTQAPPVEQPDLDYEFDGVGWVRRKRGCWLWRLLRRFLKWLGF